MSFEYQINTSNAKNVKDLIFLKIKSEFKKTIISPDELSLWEPNE